MTTPLHQRDRGRQPVDWPALHARLREAMELALAPGQLAADADRARLVERARRFACLPDAQGPPTQCIEALEFELGPERIAVAACFVATVQALKILTPLPRTPAHMRGIVDVRGNLVAVLDLGIWLQLPRRGITQLDQLIVLQAQSRQLALLADRIVGVRSLDRALVQPCGDGSSALSVVGGGRTGPGRVLLVDVEQLFASSNLLSDQRGTGLPR